MQQFTTMRTSSQNKPTPLYLWKHYKIQSTFSYHPWVNFKTNLIVLRWATLHCQRCCSELVSCVTGVVATVFRIHVLYTELLNAPFLPHLKLLTRLEDHASLPPLNTSTWLRHLTAQGNIITLYGIQVLELFAEENRGTWWEFEMGKFGMRCWDGMFGIRWFLRC